MKWVNLSLRYILLNSWLRHLFSTGVWGATSSPLMAHDAYMLACDMSERLTNSSLGRLFIYPFVQRFFSRTHISGEVRPTGVHFSSSLITVESQISSPSRLGVSWGQLCTWFPCPGLKLSAKPIPVKYYSCFERSNRNIVM